jgi:hypothetical protein
MVAVYDVPSINGADGVSVTVLAVTAIVPFTPAPPARTSVMLAGESVALVIASENVALMAVFTGTDTAPPTGSVEVTAGAVRSAATAVVNDQLTLDVSALPARSVAAVVIDAVYCVFAASAVDGMNITLLPFTVTVPVISVTVPARMSVTLDVVSVAMLIGSENVAATVGCSATDVAPLTGSVLSTVGTVVSGGGAAATVVNDHVTFDASALPATSVTAVLMVIVYCVPDANAADGVNVAVLPVNATSPVTAGPAAAPAPALLSVTVTLAAVNDAVFIASENVTETVAFSATPVAPLVGVVAVTVGAVVSVGGVRTALTDSPQPSSSESAPEIAPVSARRTATGVLRRPKAVCWRAAYGRPELKRRSSRVADVGGRFFSIRIGSVAVVARTPRQTWDAIAVSRRIRLRRRAGQTAASRAPASERARAPDPNREQNPINNHRWPQGDQASSAHDPALGWRDDEQGGHDEHRQQRRGPPRNTGDVGRPVVSGHDAGEKDQPQNQQRGNGERVVRRRV